MAVKARCRRREPYVQMLARLWGLYGPLEAALARIDWPGAETLVRQRAKTGWLAADLHDFGLGSRTIESLPKATVLPAIAEVADVFGVLYVLEGATLGGQIILAQVTAELGATEDAGARFFASYGSEVGVRWRSFVEALERFGEPPRVADRIERAAMTTFEIFGSWMSEDAAAPTPREGRRDVG
jgi:heme oxygenase